MSVLGTILLFIMNILVGKFQLEMGLDTFSEENISEFVYTVQNFSEIYNIFAWVDKFVSVNVLFALATFTTLYYSYKFILGLVKYIISIFK